MERDPYLKLKNPPHVSHDEQCACLPPRIWKVMSALHPNPIHCIQCNLVIRPEQLELPSPLIDEIASWQNVYASIDRLWLDSGPYEKWALSELSNLASPLNQRGLALAQKLRELNPCYYQVFEDQSSDDWKAKTVCLKCGKDLRRLSTSKHAHSVCDSCSLIFWAEQ